MEKHYFIRNMCSSTYLLNRLRGPLNFKTHWQICMYLLNVHYWCEHCQCFLFVAKSDWISNISKNKDQKSKPFLFTNINLCADNKKSSIFSFPILFSTPPSQPHSSVSLVYSISRMEKILQEMSECWNKDKWLWLESFTSFIIFLSNLEGKSHNLKLTFKTNVRWTRAAVFQYIASWSIINILEKLMF